MRTTFALLFTLSALSGCGEDPIVPADADVPTDAGPTDSIAPEIEQTTPADGAGSVVPDVQVHVRFSEAMDASVGTVAITHEGSALAAPNVEWSADGTRLSIAPAAALPSPAEVTVTFTGFTDLAGNALAAPTSISFSTADVVPPRATASTPIEGASDVSLTIGAVEITFDEAMEMSHGSLVLEGGPGTVSALTWSGQTARADVAGLAGDTAYALRLVDFRDRAGNLLDGAPYLEDGALDFTTGADDQGPVVTESDPMEGQLDVSLDGVTRVAVRFSEPMDTSVGAATLTVGGDTVALTIEWQGGGTRALLDVGGLLAVESAHAITFEGFADVSGNALDTATYLGDGALDFTTGEDSFVPFVTFATPEESAVGVDPGLRALVVVFSERMDEERDSIVIRDDTGRAVTRTGTWGPAGTYLNVPLVPGDLLAGFSYTVDVRAFMDLSGSPIDATHAYLGDGILSFATLATRTGESCRDPLTVAEATTTGGVHVWDIASGAWTDIDGNFTCDPSGGGDDGLIYYRKTTADIAGGGAALRIRASSPSTAMDVEVYEGTCGTDLALADAARRRCLYYQNPWETFLDVGPGDYFIWVAENNGTFSGGTVTLEEVAAPTEGESCGNPWDVTTTSEAVYTAPATASDPHVWQIPAGSATSVERAVSHATSPLGCAPGRDFDNDDIGSDAVVRFDKTTATSALIVRVEPGPGSAELDVQLSDACEATDPSFTELGCFYGLGNVNRPSSYEVTLTGAAGPRFVWLNTPDTDSSSGWNDFPGATVRVTEVEPTVPGDSCANAIPITVGSSIAITPDRPHRIQAPSCISGGVTWYRYTASERLGIVRAANGAAIGAMEAAPNAALQCRASTLDQSLPVVVTPGSDVCIAVASGISSTTLSIEERPYTGVVGRATDLGVTIPVGQPFAIGVGSQLWMTATPTTLYAAAFGEVYNVPLAGGVDVEWFEAPTSVLGDDGLTIGETLYMVSGSSFSATTMAPLVYRVADPSGVAVPETIDTNPMYQTTVPLNAMAHHGTDLWIASDTSTAITTTYFYRLPVAGGDPVQVGSNHALQSVSAMAVDGTFVYVMGRIGDTTTGTEGIWRLRRDELTNPDAVPFEVHTGGLDYSNDNGALYVDNTGTTTWLYFRTYRPSNVYFVVDPDEASPIFLGALWTPGGSIRPDNGMAYLPSPPALFVIDTSVATSGTWFRID